MRPPRGRRTNWPRSARRPWRNYTADRAPKRPKRCCGTRLWWRPARGPLGSGNRPGPLQTARHRRRLRDGKIPYENAKIIAGASRRGDIDEAELARVAQTQSPDKFAGTVRKHEQQRQKTTAKPGWSINDPTVCEDQNRPGRRHDVPLWIVRSHHRSGHRICLIPEDGRVVREEQPGERPTPDSGWPTLSHSLLPANPKARRTGCR